jgi:hypothetical protein
MNTVRLAEEMYEEHGKDGETETHKPGTSSGDLRPVLKDD